ncbi:MAG: hypothetical protein ABIB47_04760 [Candidatus Woesearchaeota archaeon]
MVRKSSSRITKQDIIDHLVKNNIELQKKTADLLISMNILTKKVDGLVEIFQKAAEHIEKGEIKEPLARKLTDLLEQNKKIAHGLLLLERFVRSKENIPLNTNEKEDFGSMF